jgi:hypothetical protein
MARRIDAIVPAHYEVAGRPSVDNRLKTVLRSLGFEHRTTHANDGLAASREAELRPFGDAGPCACAPGPMRNFGHQAALNAGRETADSGAAVLGIGASAGWLGCQSRSSGLWLSCLRERARCRAGAEQ